MKNQIKAVFFDWAGTMVDFGSRAPVLAMQSAFLACGVEVSEASVRAHMGKAKRDHVMSMFTDADVSSRWIKVKGSHPGDAEADALMIELEPAMAREAAKASKLIPGAKKVFDDLVASGIKVGSSTGYTHTMMAEVVRLAADQGYHPQTILCAGDTSEGRPAPFMLWQAMINLGVWPARNCVAVDDAPVGILAGREAGMWTVGLAGSGNALGLDEEAYVALDPTTRIEKLKSASAGFVEAGADFIIATIADLPGVLGLIEAIIAKGVTPGAAPSLLDHSVTG
ncbi:COG0637 Predicted phosphatase/phosphohexomutase [Caulobacteraceae bacterium]